MKKLIKINSLAMLISLFFIATANSTPVYFNGYYTFKVNAARPYFRIPPAQSGHYKSLGSGYYRSGYIDGGDIQNHSYFTRSGSLSLEFIRMDYYGGNSGNVMFSRGYSPLKPRYLYPNVYKSGYFKSAGRYGYGVLEVVEFQSTGRWAYTDRINYSARQYF